MKRWLGIDGVWTLEGRIVVDMEVAEFFYPTITSFLGLPGYEISARSAC